MIHQRSFLFFRLALLFLLCGLGAAIGFGYLGWLHLAFDAFAHLRLYLAALLLLLAPALLALRLRIEAVFAIVLGLAAIIQTALPDMTAQLARKDTSQPTYRLMQMNLRFDNPTPEAALSLIGSMHPDVVTFGEVSDMWRERLGLLEAAYPYRVICPKPSHIGGTAILSRRPFVEGFEPHCGDRGSFAKIRLDLGGREIEIATLHMGWPWPFEQPWQMPRLIPLLESVDNDAIIVGDLNAVPWSHAARRIAEASDAQILRGIGPSWLDRRLPDQLRPLIGLPIDNLMFKGDVIATGLQTFTNAGSDHLAILLEFSLSPRPEPEVTEIVSR